MKKLILCFIISVVILSGNSLAFVTLVTDDGSTIDKKNGKATLKQTWYAQTLELDNQTQFGAKKLQKVDTVQYQEAINQIDAKVIDKIGEYKVYFLDSKLKEYKNILGLSFKDNTAVIFGTYYKLSEKAVHNLAIHEFGHNVDFQLMNDNLWKEYKEIRGITNETKYSNNSKDSSNRPQEIFADDFRVLFGGEFAREAAHVNKDLTAPNDVEGLKEFFNRLF